jgi:hypothetical protein
MGSPLLGHGDKDSDKQPDVWFWSGDLRHPEVAFTI